MYVTTINIHILFLGLLFNGAVLETSLGNRIAIDPCEDDSERHLHDMHRRFKNYKTAFQRKHEEMVCDKYLIPQHGAWFMSYNDMPSEPPTFLDCGTTHPIWLNGTIPTISEGVVDRTACKVGFMSYCDEEIPVRIKRCEKYTAYFLLPTKHCPEAYCFGIKKDPPLPKPVVKPTLYNKNESSVDRLQFECYMNISSLNFAYYEVTWKWGTSSLTLKNESSQFSSLRLTDEHFKTLGVDITCTVKALHFEHDVLGLNATSNTFYAGLQFQEHIIKIQKGEVVMIPYQLTIPLSCQMDTCGISVNVIIKGKSELDTCDGQLYAIPRGNSTIDIMPNDWNTTHNIEMKHIGRKGYGVKPSSFTVGIKVDLSNSNFIHHVNIPELHVNVQDSDSNRKVCSAYNDPHMKTFDGLSYEHQQPGTYLLYEHNILERHMQVQMELTPCNSNVAYCICGLAVRAGGDIFVIYLCGGKTIIKYGTCYDKILRVKRAKRNTKQYKITFPTGTEISANIFLHGGYGGTMNVEVRGSGDDRGQSQGLCGRMTGKREDNMLIRGKNSTDTTGGSWSKYQDFSDSWSVKDSENLFRWPNDLPIDKWTDFKLNPEESSVLSCDNDNSYEIVQPASCEGNYSLSIPKIVNKILPTKTGTHRQYNISQAQTFCKTEIKATNAYKECAAGLPGIDWEHFYEMCWHDIQLTDSTMWAEQTIRAVLERCVVEVKNKDKDESHNTTTVNPIKVPNLDKLCPNDCHHQGTCNDAICTCNQQFLGIDCSVSITNPPTITEIVGLKSGEHTWCDKNEAGCYSFVLYGHEIEQSGSLTCKIEQYLAMSNNTFINVSTHIVNATVKSLSEVHCSLTNRKDLEVTFNHTRLYVEEYRVSLSYNNRNYGPHLTLRVFNGDCHDIYHPQTNNVVGLKKTTCFINGICTSKGVNDIHNEFMVCNPDIDPLKWTFDSKHNCKINGTFYHHKDKNKAKQCLSCNPNVSSNNWTLVGECLIHGVCYDDLSNHPFDELYICNSSYSTTEWSMNQTIPVPDIRIHVSSNSFNETYEMECHLDTSRMNYTYFIITWLWGNNSKVFQDTSDNLQLMRLPGNSITDLGINVSCRIEGQYELNKVVTTFRSNEFYVGIKTNSPVEIEKGGTAKLRYWLTVPLSCNNCSVHLSVVDTVALGAANYDGCDGDIVTLSQWNRCDFEINNANWNVSKTLSIKHRPNRQYGVQLDTFLIMLEAVVSGNIWTVLEVPDMKVKIIQHDTEWHSKVCSAYSDPHMTTFDGLHYEHQYKGRYTMYQNKQRNMEVQIQLTSCYNDNVFCACGIAVRAGADVFVINFCDGWSVIQFVACEYASVLYVSKMKHNNQHYRITFPTGTSISVRIARVNPVNFLDIEIRPSADDFNNTEGLCGTLTNSCEDDFPLRNGSSKATATSCHNRLYSFANKEFSDSWIVSPGNDLFSLHDNSPLTIWTSTEQYCKCTSRENGTTSDKCGNSLYPSVYCTDSGFEPFETTCRNNVLDGKYTLTIPKTKEENHIAKPGNALIFNKSLNESIRYCKNKLVSKEAFKLCSQINNIPSQHFEEICAIDIYMSHTFLWIAQTYETMMSRCSQEINLNATLQTSQTKEGKTFTEIMGNKLCPGFIHTCTGNGACRNGICVCDYGFMSQDCSFSTSTVPTVDHIQNNGLCDKSKGACHTVYVHGHIIYEAKVIFCRIQTFYMFEDKTFQYGYVTITGGKINSLVEIQCSIPEKLLIEKKFTSYIARGFTVSVGHNKRLFSTKTFKYFEFEPKCQIPRGTEANRFFEIANGTCFVNGKCYSDMEINPINSFEFCDYQRKQQEWSFNETSVCKINGKYVPKSNLTSNNECQSCNPEKSVYNWTVVDNECFINYACYSHNDRNPQYDQEYCNPLNSQTRWTFNESVLVPYVRPALLKVHQTNMNVDVERLYFECVMDLNRLFYKFYEVTWTWGRNLTLILGSDVHSMKNLWLTENHFHSLGTNISCTLRGKHTSEDKNGTVFTSQPFFAGIHITELMNVQKGGSAELSYNLTVPFGCLSFNNRTLPCFIELNMLSPDYTKSDQCYGDIVNLEHCRVKIWRDSWSTPRTLAIKHRGRQMYGVFPEQISMKLKTSSADHPLWDTTKIPEIKVHVYDNKVELQERVCSAYNVHFTTFDGLHYEQPFQGTFTMYYSRRKEQNMMVQVKLTQCDETRGVHCICGVAVRAGGDVYVFDFCGGNSIIQYMACQQQLLDVTTRSKDNKKYKITFPTGTEVAVNIQYIGTNTFMDVEIRASDSDFNMTEGLCGTLNDQCNDDFAETGGKFSTVICHSDAILPTIPQHFSDSWRVSGSNDLFNISNGEQIALWTNHDEYCSCPSVEISDKFECSAKSTIPCNRNNDYKTIGQSTCKLSPIDNFNLPTKNRTHLNPMTFKPELVNISLSGAQSLCREAIENNTAFKACSVVPNMPSEYFIQICAFEVEKSKSHAWIRHTVDSMKSRCLSEVQKNETLNDQPSEDIPSITETVIMAICPGLPECSGNGKCDHGVCVCNEGFMSHDCSMTKTVPPQIYGVRGNGICDRNEIDCDTAFVVGSRIEESDELSCRISKYVIHPDGNKSFEGTTIVSGNVETLVEVHCPLKTPKQKRSVGNTGNIPFVEVFDVSVSYNREDFSNPETVILMNSKCQQNNGTTTKPIFVLKDDTCFIDHQCLLDNEPNPQNEYLYCNAQLALFEWTFDDSENCKVEDQYFSRNNMIFDKDCLLCNPDKTSLNWTLKENYCFIDGVCVPRDEKNTVDDCLLCNTGNNLFEWTKHDEVCITKVVKPSDTEKSSSKLGLILLGSIGSVVILFIVGFIVNCYVKNNNSRLKKKSTYEADEHCDMRRLPRLKVKT